MDDKDTYQGKLGTEEKPKSLNVVLGTERSSTEDQPLVLGNPNPTSLEPETPVLLGKRTPPRKQGRV